MEENRILNGDPPFFIMKIRFILMVGILFVVAGLLLGFDSLRQHLAARGQLSVPSTPPVANVQAAVSNDTEVVVQGKPVRLVAPSIGLDIAIADGIYNFKNKTWTLSKDKAHYAVMTIRPNNKEGNTFIYGHNRREVFSGLAKLKPGDTVTVYTDNNHTFVYRFRSAYDTKPNDDSIFKYTGDPILTLQTCSGAWFQNRRLFTLDLVEAK